MSPFVRDTFIAALRDTILMVVAAGSVAFVCGLLLAVAIAATAPGGIRPLPLLHRILNGGVTVIRSTPFLILLVALIPFTRMVVGTSIGLRAAIVPLSIAAIPYFARIAELSLRDVDSGLTEAAKAMGANGRQIVTEVWLPEALPGIIGGFTIVLVALIDATALAGAVGAGGLGDLAMRYGYQEFDTTVMFAVLIILVAMVAIVQATGDTLARRLDRRR